MPLRKLIMAAFLLFSIKAAGYTTVYNGTTYYSASPYNLNVYYFKPADVPLDASYRRRISAMMLWLQNFYKQQMQASGYSPKTFGLYTDQAHIDSIRIVIINGMHNIDAYRSTTPGGNDSLQAEVNRFIDDNPTLQVSRHSLVLIATPNVNAMQGLPYYGVGRLCYATDYPQLDMQYMGQTGALADKFVTNFGGIAHELGHALNLPHSHQTATEDAVSGTNLMANGNYTLTRSPTFINRAGCAILNNCEVFSASPNANLYNGHLTGLLSLHGSVSNGNFILSGRFISNRPVKDVNIYQDPFAVPSQGYARVAFSVPPSGVAQDSFHVIMPASEVIQNDPGFSYPPNGPYNLQVELVLENGETSSDTYYYQYVDSLPVFTDSFDDTNCPPVPGNWTLTDIGATLSPGQACYNASDSSIAMRSWGNGIGAGVAGSSDNITFLHTSIGPVDTITARVRSVSDTWNYLSGLMIRNTLDSGSAFSAVSALDARGVFWNWRTTANSSSAYDLVTTQALPMWLRLTRNGNNINSWYGADGINWTLYHSSTWVTPDSVYVGVVVSGAGVRSVIDHITVGGKGIGLGVGDATKRLSLNAQVYPNPAHSSMHLTFASAAKGHADIGICDLSGRVIIRHEIEARAGLNNMELSVAGLTPGVYLLRVHAADGAAGAVKIVVNR